MITLFVFYIHVVIAVTAFTRRWQEAGWTEAFLAAGFVALIFSVGWSIATVFAGFIISREGFGPLFDRDAFALVLLTILEGLFYSVQTRRRNKRPPPVGQV